MSAAQHQRRPDYRLLEEELADVYDAGDAHVEGHEELEWEAGPRRSKPRRGRAHAASALVAGLAVSVALLLHALGGGAPAGSVSPGGVRAGRGPGARQVGDPLARASRPAAAPAARGTPSR
jgi:hypothetical protein